MNHTPKISFDGCGLNDANDPYKRRLFTAEDRNESRNVGMYIERACNAHEELVKIARAYRNHLKVSAHTEGEVATYQHINNLLTAIEKGT